MKKIDVLFFVEHKDRELDITLAISKILKKDYGLNVEIVSLLFEGLTSAIKFSPKVIITPSTAFGKGSVAWLFFMIYGKKIEYINLNYEQFISSWKGSYKTPSNENCIKYQKQFVWGEYFKNVLTKGGIPEENISVTGRPLSQLIEENYIKTKDSSRAEIRNTINIDNQKKWNFIAFTDGLGFVNEKKIQYIVKNGADEIGLRKHVDIVKKTISSLVEWTFSYASEFPEEDIFILRPHPSVSENQYMNLFFERFGRIPKNIIITKKFSAYKWLSASDNFITNYSTLCLDAKKMKKETFMIDQFELAESNKYWYCNDAYVISSYYDFRNIFFDKNTLSKFSSKYSDEYIDDSLNGLNQTAKKVYEIQKEVTRVNFKLFGLILALLNSPKRLIGGIIRKILAKSNIHISGISKKGITNDFLHPKDKNVSFDN